MLKLERVIELNEMYTDILRNFNEGVISYMDAHAQIETLNSDAAAEDVPFKIDPDTLKQVVELEPAVEESSSEGYEYFTTPADLDNSSS